MEHEVDGRTDGPPPGRSAGASASLPDGPDTEGRTAARPAPPAVLALLRGVDAVRHVVDGVLKVTCVVIFVVLVVVVSWQVISRQVFGDPATWTEESARYIFVVLALLGAALVFSERGHIAVELFVQRLPVAAQRGIAVLVEVAVSFFALYVLVIGGYRVANNSWAQNISTLPLSVGQVYLILPLAGVLILFYSLYHLLAVLTGTEKPVADVDDAAEGI